MTPPLIVGALWVVAGALTSFLSGKRQRIPATLLFFSAPALLVWIGTVHGYAWTAFGLAVFASMFRRAVVYVICRALGLPARDPRLKLDEVP